MKVQQLPNRRVLILIGCWSPSISEDKELMSLSSLIRNLWPFFNDNE